MEHTQYQIHSFGKKVLYHMHTWIFYCTNEKSLDKSSKYYNATICMIFSGILVWRIPRDILNNAPLWYDFDGLYVENFMFSKKIEKSLREKLGECLLLFISTISGNSWCDILIQFLSWWNYTFQSRAIIYIYYIWCTNLKNCLENHGFSNRRDKCPRLDLSGDYTWGVLHNFISITGHISI